MVASPFKEIEARLDRIEHWVEQQMEINNQVRKQLTNHFELLENQHSINRALEEKTREKG